MKKNTFIFLNCLVLVILLTTSQLGQSQGFASTPTNWTLPAGGLHSLSHNAGFTDLEYANLGNTNSGSQNWSVLDLNNDNLPDLIITSQGDATSTHSDCLGVGTSPHWLVYLGTATGFSTTSTTWSLPMGGYINSGHASGFNSLANTCNSTVGNQGWSVLDVNSDNKPDLVVTSQGNGTNSASFGVGTNPHWLVYLNTGQGFATTPTTWALPAGGAVGTSGTAYGFYDLTSEEDNISGSQGWSVLDVNSDNKPDLVVTSQGNGTNSASFGVGTNPHWLVYLNTGQGFATTPTTWALPAGGAVGTSGTAYGFYSVASQEDNTSGSQGWSVLDMNSDNLPDLVVVSQGDGIYVNSFGVGTNSHWLVYLNTGQGFASTSTNWTLPAGGYIVTNGHVSGFNVLSFSGSYMLGGQNWSVLDANGDGRPDLVVTSQGILQRNVLYEDSFDVGTAPHWLVYLGTANGFATTPTNWMLPAAGGFIYSGHNHGFNYIVSNSNTVLMSSYAGTLNWGLLDVNADNHPDLIVASQSDGTYQDSFGVGTNPHWLVYLNTTVSSTRASTTAPTLAAYPNPTTGSLTLLSAHTALGQPYILADALGRVMQRGTVTAETQILDLSELPDGVYVIQASGRNLRVLKQ